MSAFRDQTLKQKLMKVSFDEITRMRKQKFLHLWIAETDKKQRGEHANDIMSFSLVHQVYSAWKALVYNKKLADKFKATTYGYKLKMSTIQAL